MNMSGIFYLITITWIDRYGYVFKSVNEKHSCKYWKTLTYLKFGTLQIRYPISSFSCCMFCAE